MSSLFLSLPLSLSPYMYIYRERMDLLSTPARIVVIRTVHSLWDPHLWVDKVPILLFIEFHHDETGMLS